MKTYQKGETVVFTVKVKNQEGETVANEIVKLSICSSSGEKIVEDMNMMAITNGSYEGSYSLPTDINTGLYVVIVKVGSGAQKTITRDGFRVVPTCA